MSWRGGWRDGLLGPSAWLRWEVVTVGGEGTETKNRCRGRKAEGNFGSWMEGHKPGAPEAGMGEQDGSQAGAAFMVSCFPLPREPLVLMVPLAEMVPLESR